MNQSPVLLKEVDCIEVLTLMDNYTDVLLENTEIATRLPEPKGEEIPTDTLLAEHGLSLLLTVHRGEEKHTLLFDTGHTQVGVLHNMEILEVNPDEVETIVLSHAHMDHTGCLYPLLDQMTRPMTLAVHPDAFLFPRFKETKDGKRLRFPRTLIKDELINKKVDILETKAPTPILSDMVMITGGVERQTAFEKGLPNALIERDGKMEEDPIADDQSLAIHLKGKGLVVVSGCSHAGIINTVLQAKEITGVQKVHGILGGFHLIGPKAESLLESTIEELVKMEPEVLVPMHCTGWKGIHRIYEEFAGAFTLNSVGTKITLNTSFLT
jgi:7,8-dihydropterin-6-yl-methyl-4-(beta-D-ribofuranosyl)aminobenzene 5'-phosphate synthase